MSDSTGKSLTHKQELALAALVAQPTLGLAASQVKVSERTLYRWPHDDSAFKAEYLRLRQEIVNDTVFQLQKATNNAVNVAIALMNDPETPASTRLAAAKVVLETSFQALQAELLEERLTQVEERLNELGIKNHPNGKATGYPAFG